MSRVPVMWETERARQYANQIVPRVLLRSMKRSSTTCHYCGRRIRLEEAVVRDDIVMCQKCAENHPLMADVNKNI